MAPLRSPGPCRGPTTPYPRFGARTHLPSTISCPRLSSPPSFSPRFLLTTLEPITIWPRPHMRRLHLGRSEILSASPLAHNGCFPPLRFSLCRPRSLSTVHSTQSLDSSSPMMLEAKRQPDAKRLLRGSIFTLIIVVIIIIIIIHVVTPLSIRAPHQPDLPCPAPHCPAPHCPALHCTALPYAASRATLSGPATTNARPPFQWRSRNDPLTHSASPLASSQSLLSTSIFLTIHSSKSQNPPPHMKTLPVRSNSNTLRIAIDASRQLRVSSLLFSFDPDSS